MTLNDKSLVLDNDMNLKPLWLFLWIFFFFGGCESKENTEKPTEISNYKVIDSGLAMTNRVDDKAYWLDDHKVIFEGYRYPKGDQTVKDVERGLFIWDIQQNKVDHYANGGGLCYQEGHIYYGHKVDVEKDPNKPIARTWKEGVFGQEKLQIIRETEKESEEWYQYYIRSEISCRVVKRPPSMKGRSFVPLLEGDGYLDFGTYPLKHDQEKVRLVNEQIVHELPFTRIDVGALSGQYYPYKKAYFFWRNIFGKPVISGKLMPDLKDEWASTGCLNGWWVWADGKTEYVCIPWGEGARGAVRIAMYKNGILVNSRQGKQSGLFLLGKQSNLLISGYVTGVSISPSGCKVAFAHAPLNGPRGFDRDSLTLKIIELCTEENQGVRVLENQMVAIANHEIKYSVP